jgi:hypothetical protein
MTTLEIAPAHTVTMLALLALYRSSEVLDLRRDVETLVK